MINASFPLYGGRGPSISRIWTGQESPAGGFGATVPSRRFFRTQAVYALLGAKSTLRICPSAATTVIISQYRFEDGCAAHTSIAWTIGSVLQSENFVAYSDP